MWGPYFANHKKYTQESTSETSRTHSHHPNTIAGKRSKTLFIHINWAAGTASTQLAKHQGLWQIRYANFNKNRVSSTIFSTDINRKVSTLLFWPLTSDNKTIISTYLNLLVFYINKQIYLNAIIIAWKQWPVSWNSSHGFSIWFTPLLIHWPQLFSFLHWTLCISPSSHLTSYNFLRRNQFNPNALTTTSLTASKSLFLAQPVLKTWESNKTFFLNQIFHWLFSLE